MGGVCTEQGWSPHCCELWEWVEGGGGRGRGAGKAGQRGLHRGLHAPSNT